MKELTNDERFEAMLSIEKLKKLSDRIIQQSLGKLTVGDFSDYRKMDLLNKALAHDVHFTLFWTKPETIAITEKIDEATRVAVRDNAYRYRDIEDLQWERYQLAVIYARDRNIIE